jgi:serine/threonine protein kinase
MASPRPQTRISADRWQRIERLFFGAAELGTTELAEYLDRECAADRTLRLQVESLLLASGESCQLAEEVVAAAAESVIDSPDTAPGTFIGPYRLERLLGRGGMGEVYLAERADDAYRKQVAIKLVRTGLTSDALHRFRAERQILARLEHPHIARLLEGGSTPSGLPFLVMEYVQGSAITDYAKPLALREKVELFRTVCDAVQYAHANLVVHRDLKPGNIMVTAEGVVKLVDFGIAKPLLSDMNAPGVTLPFQRVLTPEYASPEQFLGEPVSTAADVYSLGVILYELLTGSLPLEFTTRRVSEMERIVREVEPPRPSVRCGDKRLRGDLDNIARKALEKDPRQRYASAAELSNDIGRWLTGYPVRARKPSRRDRAVKFVRRHRLGVATTVAITLLLAAGIISLRSAQLRAERRFQQVRAVANTFLFDFEEAIQAIPGTLPAQALVVRKAQEYLDGLASEASGDLGLETDLAQSYDRLGEIQYTGGGLRLGDVGAAIANVKKAVALREALVRQSPSNSEFRQSLANSYDRLGSIMRQGANVGPAVALNEKAIELLIGCLKERPHDRQLRLDLAETYKDAADAYRMLGKWPQSIEYSDRGIELRSALAREDPKDDDNLNSLAAMYIMLADTLRDSIGYVQRQNGKMSALEYYKRSLELHDEISHRSPKIMFLRQSALARGRLARGLLVTNDLPQARRYFAEAVDIYTQLVRRDPGNEELERSLSVANVNLALSDIKAGNYPAAETGLEHAVKERRSFAERDPSSLEAADDLAYALTALGGVQTKLHHLAGARESLTESLRLRDTVGAKRPKNVEDRARLGSTWAAMGDLEKSSENRQAAEQSYQKALDVFSGLETEGKLQDRDKETYSNLPKQISALRFRR